MLRLIERSLRPQRWLTASNTETRSFVIDLDKECPLGFQKCPDSPKTDFAYPESGLKSDTRHVRAAISRNSKALHRALIGASRRRCLRLTSRMSARGCGQAGKLRKTDNGGGGVAAVTLARHGV